ncbi:hypothetical protein LXL04_028466 [Taraxacum kok-saghyz]
MILNLYIVRVFNILFLNMVVCLTSNYEPVSPFCSFFGYRPIKMRRGTWCTFLYPITLMLFAGILLIRMRWHVQPKTIMKFIYLILGIFLLNQPRAKTLAQRAAVGVDTHCTQGVTRSLNGAPSRSPLWSLTKSNPPILRKPPDNWGKTRMPPPRNTLQNILGLKQEEQYYTKVKMSAVCGPHLQSSAEEEVAQTSAVCSKKTVCFFNICRLQD